MVQSSVQVISGDNGPILYDFRPDEIHYTGGISITALDYNGDGHNDIFTAANGRRPVKVFDGQSGARIDSFSPFTRDFVGGIHLGAGAGDIDGDGVLDLLLGTGRGMVPRVKVLSGATHDPVVAFLILGEPFKYGKFVAGLAEIA